MIQNVLERQIEELRYNLSISKLKQLQQDIELDEEQGIQNFFSDLNTGLNKLQEELFNTRYNLLVNTRGFVKNLDSVQKDFQQYKTELSSFRSELETYQEIVAARKNKLEEIKKDVTNNKDAAETVKNQECGSRGEDYSNVFLIDSQFNIPSSADNCDLLSTGVGFISYFDLELTIIIKELEDVEDGLNNLDYVLANSVEELDRYINAVDEEKGLVAQDLSETLSNLERTLTSLTQFEDETATARDDLASFTNKLNSIRDNLDFDSFVEPINYKIRNTLSNSSTLDNFLPLILSVVMLFTSLLLGVVIHKKETKSNGYRRNILQGSRIRFYLANYFFVLIIVLVEIFVLLVAFYVLFNINYYLNILFLPIFQNIYI